MLHLGDFDLAIQAVIGSMVWAVANVVYVDLKRKGVRNFARFAAFWMGTPTTWVSLFLVSEGERIKLEPVHESERALLDEIREDRLRRSGGSAPRVDPEDEGAAIDESYSAL